MDVVGDVAGVSGAGASVVFGAVVVGSRVVIVDDVEIDVVEGTVVVVGSAEDSSAPSSSSASSAADAYFDVLAGLVVEWLDKEAPLWLPTTTDPLLKAVMAYTDEHLATVTAADACRAVGLSERTLRRRFPEVVGVTWRAYLLQCRLLRAMALLAEGGSGRGHSRSILDVATAVGFDSASAFTRAFRRTTGESPSAYRSRTRGGGGRG